MKDETPEPSATEATEAQSGYEDIIHFGPRREVSAADKRAADERSHVMKRQRVERLFAEPFWPAERVLLWIAFCDPARLEDNFLGAMFEAKTYRPASAIGVTTYRSVSLHDFDPRGTLLRSRRSVERPGFLTPSRANAPARP
jgi:hypothetical protein